MAIPREYGTSNPVVRDALALIPPPTGTRLGDFIAPDFPIDAETVDTVSMAVHELNLDDLRAADAEAKSVRFEVGAEDTVSVVERALKTTMDSRKIEEAGKAGVDIIVQRLDLLRTDIIDAKEYRIVEMATTQANFAGDHYASATNFRTVDLFSTVEAMQDKLVADGNYPGEYAVIDRYAWGAARLNSGFNQFVAGPNIKAGARDLTLAKLAEYLGLAEVRIGDFRRKIAGAVKQFWPVGSFLLFARQVTLSDRTFAQTAVCPYGQYQGAAQGTLVDARTSKLPGTEELVEVGAYHRYRTIELNQGLGFLTLNIVKT